MRRRLVIALRATLVTLRAHRARLSAGHDRRWRRLLFPREANGSLVTDEQGAGRRLAS